MLWPDAIFSSVTGVNPFCSKLNFIVYMKTNSGICRKGNVSGQNIEQRIENGYRAIHKDLLIMFWGSILYRCRYCVVYLLPCRMSFQQG